MKNKTLIIVLGIFGGLMICCCGGFFIVQQNAPGLIAKVSEDYTDQVAAFMNRASATWSAADVADQIYTADGNTQRPEFVQIVFNELKAKGSVTKVEGTLTGINDQTTNGARTQTFKWAGTVTLTNGTSPLQVEMIKTGEKWLVKDIYLR